MMTTPTMLLAPVVIPAVIALLAFALPKKLLRVTEVFSILGVLSVLVISVLLYGQEITLKFPWAGQGLDFELRLYHFSSFILVASAGFSLLVACYSAIFMHERPHAGFFWAGLLLTQAFTAGAVLADNLVVMLFFWEGLLCMLFLMIWIGGATSWKTAVKALMVVGLSDLCMMFGIGLTGHLAGTLTISGISALPLDGLGALAFILLMIGATSKAGALPFHTWIPDAAIDAPLPFMAFLPAALEKLLGIYFLARISMDLFALTPGSWVSTLLMVLGAVTILIAVMMALIQKDFKRLLSYHAISQVGYMILGIGTAIPVGMVGGLFHMINHAMYKSALFLTAGSVERQAGTTDLRSLGGLGRLMPITFGSFIIAACAISGVPPFNGFFSKELIYDGALERGWVFYLAALLGSFLTAASFFKLGHAAFLGPRDVSTQDKEIKDPPWLMLIPMVVLVLGCVLFGVYNPLPLKSFIEPVLGSRVEHTFSGIPHSWGLVAATLVVLALAFANHRFGFKRTGRGVQASDHIHHAPGLSQVYDLAERRFFDPYEVGLTCVGYFARLSFWIDRGIDWFYDVASVRTARVVTEEIRAAHTGSYALYTVWALCGLAVVLAMLGITL